MSKASTAAERGLPPLVNDNVVFIGMGEPLNNFEAVERAARLLAHPEGFALSRRNVCVSTVGPSPAAAQASAAAAEAAAAEAAAAEAAAVVSVAVVSVAVVPVAAAEEAEAKEAAAKKKARKEPKAAQRLGQSPAADDDDDFAPARPCYARASAAAATAAASSSAASTGSAPDCKRQRLIAAASTPAIALAAPATPSTTVLAAPVALAAPSAAKNPVVRAHLSALNGLGSAALSHFSFDEGDTVTFKVCTSAVRGTVSVSLFEISSYPRTGGYAYVVEGCDELTQAIESIAEQLSDRASLDNCVRLLCRALGGPPELSELLAVACLRAAAAAVARRASNVRRTRMVRTWRKPSSNSCAHRIRTA